MDEIKLYEVDGNYINFLLPYAPHLFQNRKNSQKNERKYIGVVLRVNGFHYFAPLSSFKDKHKTMKDVIDFMKVKDYAVINLNNMFPVVNGVYTYVDIGKEKDVHYRALLQAEYRYIKSIKDKILKNAATLYNIKKRDGNSTALGKRCNDFLKLEEICVQYFK